MPTLAALRLALVVAMLFITTSLYAQEFTLADQPITLNYVMSIREVAAFEAESVTQIAFMPDNRTLVVGTGNGVWLHTLSDPNAPPHLLGGDTSPAHQVAVSPDGAALAVVSGSRLHLWDVAQNTERWATAASTPVAFSPDGRLVASGVGDGTFRLLDVVTGAPIMAVEGHGDQVTGFSFSPNSLLVASSSLDMTIRLWSTETGEQLAFPRSRRRPVLSVAFSPNGFVTASGARRGVVRLVNIATGTERSLSTGRTGDVFNIAFSPDGVLLAFTSDNDIQLWDVGEGIARRVLHGHSASAYSVAFSPDGTLIASAGRDRMVRLWGVP